MTKKSVCWLILFVVFLMGGLGIKIARYVQGIYDTTQDLENTHVRVKKIDSIHGLLVRATNKYIKTIAPTSQLDAKTLVDECLNYQFDIALALAQGHLESHFGTRGVAASTNSVWNVYSYDNRSVTDIKTKNLHYKDPNDSIIPYLELIQKSYTQYGAKGIENLLTNFVHVNGARYASEKDYEKKLKSIYDSITKNTLIIELQKRLYEL